MTPSELNDAVRRLAVVQQQVDDYYVDNDDGHYEPDDFEKFMLTDFAHGLISELMERGFIRNASPLHAASPVDKRAIDTFELCAIMCEAGLVNRPDDPVANSFDDGLRHCAAVIRTQAALSAARRVPAEQRDEIIEECAKVCDEKEAHYDSIKWDNDSGIQAVTASLCADEIRALKSPRASQEQEKGK